MIELLDTADLHIETNDAGFVLGKSPFGTPLSSSANSWREVKGDFSQITLNRPMGIDKSVLFRPEAPQLGLRTVIEDYYEGVFGKSIRVRWKDDVLFIGTIKNATVASRALRDGKDQTTINVNAIGIIDYINNYVLYNVSAPQQTVAQRVAALMPSNVNVQVYGGDRVMAALGQSSPTIMEVLQDASDVAQARFYVNKHNEIILDATDVPDPTILFSDEDTDEGRVLYRSVNTQENVTNSITGLVVTAKSDQSQNKVTAVAEHPNPSMTNEQSYSVDVPAETGALEAWAESFPLQGKAVQAPTSIECFWQDALSDIELTHQVDIKWKTNGYRAGIKGITYDLRAERNGKFRWNVKYELFPGHLLGFDRLIAPSPVQNLVANGVYIEEVNDYDPTKLKLNWQPPVDDNFTHYEIRMTRGGDISEPERAPQNQNDGEQIAFIKKEDVATIPGYYIEGTLYQNAREYVIEGLDQESKYWFTVWAVTSNPDVRSVGYTAWLFTRIHVPTAPQNFTATFYKERPGDPFGNYRFEWDDPRQVATRMDRYLITTSNTNPQPSIVDSVATGSDAPPPYDPMSSRPYWGQNEAVGYGYGLNQTNYFAIRARNANGTYGPAAYALGRTNEAIPSPVKNVRHTVNAWNSVTVRWDAPDVPGDLSRYWLRWDFGGAPGLNSGYFWTTVQANQPREFTYATQGNTRYGFTVWPQTVGGRFGGSGSTVATTPTGIFSKYWEGEATWTQSYRQNNAFSSLARGFSDDLYYGYGDSFNGNQKSMIGWALPGNIHNAYAVDRVELHFYNKHAWYNTGADLWMGTHTSIGKPGFFQQSGGGQARYRVPKPGWMHLDVTWWLAQSLKNGAKGVTFGPGPNNDRLFYGFAAGVRGPRPVLKVWYRTLGS